MSRERHVVRSHPRHPLPPRPASDALGVWGDQLCHACTPLALTLGARFSSSSSFPLSLWLSPPPSSQAETDIYHVVAEQLAAIALVQDAIDAADGVFYLHLTARNAFIDQWIAILLPGLPKYLRQLRHHFGRRLLLYNAHPHPHARRGTRSANFPCVLDAVGACKSNPTPYPYSRLIFTPSFHRSWSAGPWRRGSCWHRSKRAETRPRRKCVGCARGSWLRSARRRPATRTSNGRRA